MMNVLIVPRQMKVPPQLFFAPPIALVRVSMHFTAEYASEQDADVVDHPFEAVMFAHHLWIDEKGVPGRASKKERNTGDRRATGAPSLYFF